MSDPVNHPHHYNTGKIEVIEFLEDQQFGFHLANAVKYISRAGKKDRDCVKQDIEKAIWYLRRFLELGKLDPRRPNEMTDAPKLSARLWIDPGLVANVLAKPNDQGSAMDCRPREGFIEFVAVT